ncbi:MAG TPA: WYL domain-containing protein [Actinomycetes bacterium]|nr:WYL domain-containing protein [Actinomycetes bacterium]
MIPATARLDRLLALVPYLLARPGVRVEDVAADFGISPERLVDDLQLLFVCGLPGHLPDDLIDASFEGGVVHVTNADTIARPLRLAADEAVALLAGLRMLAALPGAVGHDALDRALVKLERAAGDAAAATERMTLSVEAEDEVVATARAGLDQGRALTLDYYVSGRDETTRRTVDPMRLLVVDGRAYLEAWCRRAEAVRLFRADRVEHIAVLDEPAAVPASAQQRDLSLGLFQPTADDVVITLDLTRNARWVAEHYPCEDVEDLPGGGLRVRLRTPEPRWVVRLVLRLGADGQIVDPPTLAAEVRGQALAALAAYEETSVNSAQD